MEFNSRIRVGGDAVRGVWGGVAAACFAGTIAAADDQSSLGTIGDGQDHTKFLFFSGTDFWSTGAFVHGGLMWSPNGLDREGFTLKLLVSGGTYRYQSGALGLEVTGQQITGSAMAGWRFKFDGLEATVFVGPDVQDHKLTPDDQGSRLRGRYFGVRGGVDVWYEPGPGFMAAVNASGTTAGSEFGGGWRVSGRERGYRLGALVVFLGFHATGLKLGGFEWSAGGGWTDDSDHRSGAYGRLGVLTRY